MDTAAPALADTSLAAGPEDAADPPAFHAWNPGL